MTLHEWYLEYVKNELNGIEENFCNGEMSDSDCKVALYKIHQDNELVEMAYSFLYSKRKHGY